jgi:putative transposase
MDGLPGLEPAFRAALPTLPPSAVRSTPSATPSNAWRSSSARPSAPTWTAFFYAPTEAQARVAFTALKGTWARAYSSAVGIIERDLDSLLRFYRWEQKYWSSLRTTNPIERLNKEFKRRTKAIEITGGELNTYRLLAYVALTMNLGWRLYTLSHPKPFYALKAA